MTALISEHTLADNALLHGLPDAERQAIRGIVQPMPLHTGDVVFEEDEEIDELLFPVRGVISVVTVTMTGGSIEAALAGREGAVGVAALLGHACSPWRGLVQAPGEALRVPVSPLIEEGGSLPVLRQRLLRYAGALLQATAQAVACNRFHHLEERAARWLLSMFDSAEGDEIPLTHEFLSLMLGVHRPSVTVALRVLERAGAIELHRRSIVLHDRATLAAGACECYARIRSFSRAVIPD